RSAEALIKRAEAKSKTDPKEAQEALLLYRRYRSYRPKDLDRYADYATLCADLAISNLSGQYYGEALNALNQLVHGYDTMQPEVRRKLIDKLISLNMTFGQYATAREELLALKATGKSDGTSDLQLARCQIFTGHYDDAVRLLNELVGFDQDTKTFDVTKA